jgi:outer membrane protein insertion porin family
MKRTILFFFFILFSTVQLSQAEILKKYQVIGNDRVSKQTIINFTNTDLNKNLSEKDLNKILKNLYETTFFKDVSLNLKEGTLTINVKEYPIIQEIIFNGIKSDKQLEMLSESIYLKEKNPYNKLFVQEDLNRMLNIFKQSGYYFVDIKVKEEINTNSTINLIYDIEKGEKALIKTVKFIGDKKFKNRKLHSVITSEENKFWKFLSRGKYLNLERINLDKRLLKNFYLNKGYYLVNVENAYSQILDKKNFSVVFKINAGNKFMFNKFDIIMPNDFDPKKFEKIYKVFDELKDTTYSNRKIEKILDEIDQIALLENYEFIDAKVTETIVDSNKVNFSFRIIESEKFYVQRINILGNNITQEEFIRNQLIVDEGDPFNTLLHTKSINKLKSKGIFKSVKSEINDSDDPSQKIIDIIIEEKPTGEISAAAGVGTTGSTFAIGVKENNFNGEGIELDANLAFSKESLRGLFAYTHPNFAYSERSVTTSVENTITDKEKDYGYKSSLSRVALGTGYEQYQNIYFTPSISISSESLTTTADASANYKKQEGSYFDAIFSYGLTYDKRNSPYQPTSGFRSTWRQKIPLYADGSPLLNGYDITGYKELMDDMVFSLGFYGRTVTSIEGDDVRVSKRLFLPKNRLRGFEPGKVGPKDGADYVGGNYTVAINASSTVPYILQTMENIDLKVFIDTANVWGVDYSNTVGESSKIRSAFGTAIEILTPIGPLSFSLAQPITKAGSDKEETFRFQLGTTF